MSRAYGKRRFNRERWPWSWLRRRKTIRERFCPKCERPYLESPLPREEEQFVSGSTAALIYRVKRFGRRQFVVRVGRWETSLRGLWLSELFSLDDFDDLNTVTASARKYVEAGLDRKRDPAQP